MERRLWSQAAPRLDRGKKPGRLAVGRAFERLYCLWVAAVPVRETRPNSGGCESHDSTDYTRAFPRLWYNTYQTLVCGGN